MPAACRREIGEAGGGAQRFRGEDEMRGEREQHVVRCGRPVTVEQRRYALAHGRFQDGPDEFRKAVVGHDHVGAGH
jgi:hypothetical protein